MLSYTYRLNKLDEISSSVISLYRGVYPVVSDWPDEITEFLKTNNPDFCILVQQCKPHLSESGFKKLVEARDLFLRDIDGYINEQNDAAELFYGNSHPKKGQVRLRDNINNVLSHIE